MTTGAAWQIEQEAPEVIKPWANFDADAKLDIPFDWIDWLADKGTTYAGHTITTHPSLACTASVQSGGIVKARIEAAAALTVGTKYWVKCHIVDSDDQEDEQTLYLKAADK